MSPRPTQRAPKGRDRDRTDRRAVVDVLLARLLRGALTPAEAALLAEHTREEMRLADENRRAMAGTTQALERARAQLAAAEAAIVEAEHDRDRYKADYLAACKTIADMHEVATGRTGMGPIRGVVEDVADVGAAVSRVRRLARRMRAGSPQGAAAVYADRIEQALDNDGRALDSDTEVRAQFLAAADSTTARLAEQKRDYEIALAAERQRADRAVRTLATIRDARNWADVWSTIGMHYGWTPEECGQAARTLRNADQQAAHARADRAEANRSKWAVEADATIRAYRQRAERYKAAWSNARVRAARNDDERRAEKAGAQAAEQERARLASVVNAMHDGINKAVHEAFAERKRHRAEVQAVREQHEQQLAAVRAALPNHPRPHLGLPTDLAYASGRHDLARDVRHALGDDQPKEHPTA
ncbi:hypothetical protein MHW47_10800 [Streptomyces sp. OfavH-34-F]|uniref:hypothetical protein n=1 Tax=Streptomyces sp. OfavH-34-F TaxID=2917760 RepID=UPI001EF2E352|nr:hypothetical protein [Streptomyces sp. OfavH-34-F]MCG7524922.1 hypothetical protein [Streptomyces sp. OfavH-34-F]